MVCKGPEVPPPKVFLKIALKNSNLKYQHHQHSKQLKMKAPIMKKMITNKTNLGGKYA